MRIGIAGYAGSGKSTSLQFLCRSGCEAISADQEAKAMMQSDPTIKEALVKAFGSSVVRDDVIQFANLSSEVFQSIEKLQLLNSIVHPALLLLLEKRLRESKEPLTVLDAALIPMWDIESWFDICLWIDASTDLRIRRLKKKYPTLSEETIKRRTVLQEQLFSPPVGDKWIRLSNHQLKKDLKIRLLDICTDSKISHRLRE